MTRSDGEPSTGTARRQRSDKISDHVAREILADIVARDVAPGTMLPPEAQMMQDFQVGRASLREALRILEVQGLVQVKPGSRGGPMVAEVRSRDFGRMSTFYFHARRAQFEDLLEARLVLEPLMARMAAENSDDRSKNRLMANLQAAEDSMDDRDATWGRIAAEFHGLISGGTGNPVLDLIGSSLNDIHADRARSIFPVGQRGGVLDVHRKIADAIITGDADKAEHLARRHIQELIKGLRRLDPLLMSELIHWH